MNKIVDARTTGGFTDLAVLSFAADFKKVFIDLAIKLFDNKKRQCYIHLVTSINKIKKENKLIWATQKSTEDEEKWDQKREGRVREIKENNPNLAIIQI